MTVDLTELRNKFRKSGLSRSDLDDDPVKQFSLWFTEAIDSGIVEPTAMSLATSDESEIGLRTVLLKYFDNKGFVFYTNYESKKSRQIEKRPEAAILFPWVALDRQIKIIGGVEKVSSLESIKYFATRPKDSQIGAWASKQSTTISSRDILQNQFESMKRKFSSGEVPLPNFWGGYRVIPRTIEFWQGRESRLHDRFIYRRIEDSWTISRLSP
ncbi:MAG: pyridoxamine 5'-phosphate oxidase [Gammaproteobacteria bacterium]|jgi:pyridoxamine 5'-phosphate oxidase|nr:pyridoxamine 5'-phosphate oxidase [Gammaproteobacteria bacterium]